MAEFKFYRQADDALPPEPATAGAAGADVRAWLPEGPVTLEPGARRLIPTGLYIEVPPGHELQVRPRSGLALRHGVTLLNSPGTIDSDYRGELGIILINLGQAPFVVETGMRIAQLVGARLCAVEWRAVEQATDLSATRRGDGGFGHTGV